MGSRKNIFEVCTQFGHAVSKKFASPDVVVVPTVKPRRPRQASNRIRVGRHGMRIKVWIFLGNVQFNKTEMKIQSWDGLQKGRNWTQIEQSWGFVSVLSIFQIILSECSSPMLSQGSPCNRTVLDGIVYGTTISVSNQNKIYFTILILCINA
jgi:hypothetical protein